MIEFTTQPRRLTARVGESAEFIVAIDEGIVSGTASFQWYRGALANGSDAELIDGATTDTLTLAAVAPADIGYYFCRVNETGGSADSAIVALSVSQLKWRGSKDVHLMPGFPQRDRTPEGVRISLAYRGPYTVLRDNEPAPLSLFAALHSIYRASLEADEFSGLYLASVETTPDGAGESGPGTLRLVFQPVDPGATLEIDNATLERPVESNPYYSLITDGIWARFNTWEQESDPTLRGQLKYRIPGTEDVETLTGIIAGLAQKKLRGTTSYIASYPVVRKTSYSLEEPETGGVGKRSDPEAGPEGFEWLKTADRAMIRKSDGRWERVQEWTGAEVWDHDLYPEET